MSRLRGYSCDDAPYINHNATPFCSLLDAKEQNSRFKSTTTGNSRGRTDKTKQKVEQCIVEIKAKCSDITDKYKKWLEIGLSLATHFGEAGRQYFHDVSRYHIEYDHTAADEKYTHLLKSNKLKYNIGTFFYICVEHGIKCWNRYHVFDLVVYLFQLKQFLQFILGDKCDTINILLKSFSGLLIDGDS